MKELTADDKRLLNLLEDDEACVPRVSYLAHKLGLPTSTVKTKIDKFRKLGYVRGFSAELDPEKLDRGFLSFKLCRKKLAKESDLDTFGEKLAQLPNVQSVYFLVGEWDYFVLFRVKDQHEYVDTSAKIAVLVDECKGVVAPRVFKDTKKFVVK